MQDPAQDRAGSGAQATSCREDAGGEVLRAIETGLQSRRIVVDAIADRTAIRDDVKAGRDCSNEEERHQRREYHGASFSRVQSLTTLSRESRQPRSGTTQEGDGGGGHHDL